MKFYPIALCLGVVTFSATSSAEAGGTCSTHLRQCTPVCAQRHSGDKIERCRASCYERYQSCMQLGIWLRGRTGHGGMSRETQAGRR